jgi:hypothetical protein
MVLQCPVLCAAQPHRHQREPGHCGGKALTAAGFAVPGMTVPGLELLAQSCGAPAESAGPIRRVIAGGPASRAELAEVTR